MKPADRNGLSAGQSMRRRKHLLSGLMACGRCGGNLTVAGSGKARRYYCANAKEKGAAVCGGMPGLKERDAAETILSGARVGLMQDAAYEAFRARFIAFTRDQEKARGQALVEHDARIRRLEKTHANLLAAVEGGDFSPPVIARLNAVDADLTKARDGRAALVPDPVELPEDLPALYRAHVDDIVGTLADETVAGRASDALHDLFDTVVVSWDGEHRVHQLELRGNLPEMLAKAMPAEAAGIQGQESSLEVPSRKVQARRPAAPCRTASLSSSSS